MIMPFGKYKGKELDCIPPDYLEWVLANCRLSHGLRRAIKSAIAGDDSVAGITVDLTNRWYRALAMEFHPDQRGSHEAMKAVNRARDLLLELVGGGR